MAVAIALLSWIPVILVIFALLPPRRAVTTAFIVGWLFLPMAGYSLPGLPDYTKRSATSVGAILGMVLFHSDLLFALRFRWFDLPIATYCVVCPIASSLVNGLGIYDGCSVALNYVTTWGMPYLIGRVYFTRLEHLRELALGIAVGGLVYAPLCAWEMRMSPQLHNTVYGFMSAGWGEIVFGGYRPKVFMSCALEVGLWMTATGTLAFWLWASGSVKVLGGYPLGWLTAVLLTIAILCRVTGASIILILGISLWFLLKWFDSRRPAIALIALPLFYVGTRSTGLWTGDMAVNLIRTVLSERRADSLQFRMKNENLLAAHALKRPMFGWGGWGRNFVTDSDGRVAVVDGMWIIALGTNGLLGLVTFEAALLLPMVMLVKHYPVRAWRTPTLAPAAALATVTTLYTIDSIANAMVNPVYYLALGGVTGTLGTLTRSRSASRVQTGETELAQLLDHFDGLTGAPDLFGDAGHLAGPDPREAAAVRLGALGRSLVEHGMIQEAEEAWFSALRLWAELNVDYPDDRDYRKCWLDCANDLAWTLITCAAADDHRLARAVQLAEQTVTVEPENATYWNTLGIAYFRAGDWKAAVHALEQSTELGGGGTSFDYFFLAMAWWQQGDKQQAYQWYHRGNAWMEQHSPDHEVLARFHQEATAMLRSRPIPV
jgi:hypothetical protein